jgi:cytochrome P450
MFGADVKDHAVELREAILEVERHKDRLRAFNPLKPPQWVPTPSHQRLKKAIGTLDRFIYRMVAERRQRGEVGGDLASSLLFARDEESGQRMSDEQLRDELMTMIQAGHDTVSDAVNWTWYLLGKHPEIRQRVELEIDDALGDRVPGMEDLPRLGYVTKVIHESMRLYPPGWAFARTSLQDDNIGGHHIAANSLVALCPYVTQRMAEWWEDPETFDPERFSEERSQGRPRFAYFPFGGGPRQCIGLSMGMLETLFIVTMVAQRYRLELEPGYIAALKPGFSLKPARTIFVTLRPR